MYDNVLIATDGSDAAGGCEDYGLDLAEAMDAEVHALYVVETEATYILTVNLSDGEMDEYKEYGTEVVTDVVERAAERGLDGTGAVKTGRPAEEIVDYAADNAIDAIVIGKQGHGAIDKHLGGTAEKVMWMSEIPVTVIGGE
ncbi:universal stress protein [Halorubrum sp. DTA98]|uniref:universal stress protein n=1 Tax=Halorubrum sp. DTA98 TaxID=3402163 RepID=UPI003AAF7B72